MGPVVGAFLAIEAVEEQQIHATVHGFCVLYLLVEKIASTDYVVICGTGGLSGVQFKSFEEHLP